jgi:chloride channel protein, CIC family
MTRLLSKPERAAAGWQTRSAQIRRRLRLIRRPVRGWAAFRIWMRGSEVALVALAIIGGGAGGLIATLMAATARWLHVVLFGPGAAHGLSAMRQFDPFLVLILPVIGGLLLGLFNLAVARWRPRNPIDPIEANALYGGRMSLADSSVVGAQNLISNGFGASVGLDAAYAQAGGSLASWLGGAFHLRRADLRVLVGCGTAGAIAAAFGAPLTGAFYALELIIGSYTTSSLAPVMAGAIAGSLVARALGGVTPLAYTGGVGTPGLEDYGLAVVLGILCGLTAIALMRGVSLVEAALRRAMPWAAFRPAVGGLVVGALALITTGVLSAGRGALHFVLSTDVAVLALLSLLVLKTVAAAVSIGSGFRGGLFFASVLLGAVLGKLFAILIAPYALPELDPMLMAIVGMSAFGAAVIGAPLAMTFLALETTRDFAVAGAVLMAVTNAAIVVRRLFGYSFATWRFHLRGETIRSAHDIGWVRHFTVDKLMRRNVPVADANASLSDFCRKFPLGSATPVVAVDEANHYAGLISVPQAHVDLERSSAQGVADLLQVREQVLLPTMNAKEAMAVFDVTEADALVVVDGAKSGVVLGLLTEAQLLRRYGEELDKRLRKEIGLS